MSKYLRDILGIPADCRSVFDIVSAWHYSDPDLFRKHRLADVAATARLIAKLSNNEG